MRWARPYAVALDSTAVPSGYSPSQIRHAYGLDVSDPRAALGRLIAVVVAFHQPHLEEDLDTFISAYRLTPISGVDGSRPCAVTTGPHPCFRRTYSGVIPSQNPSWAAETALDIEWVHAISPLADLLVVEAQSDRIEDLFAAVDEALTWHPATLLMAWGTPETSLQLTDDLRFETSDVAFVAATGDAPGMISYPATSPFVIAVGATSLMLDDQGRRLSEVAWSQAAGGASRFESQPAYQAEAAPFSPRLRVVPDVSANGDRQSGYAMVTTDAEAARGRPWRTAGGSSGAAAVWAGIVSLGARDCPADVDQEPYVAQLYSALADFPLNFDARTGFGPPQAQLLLPMLCSPGSRESGG